MKPRTIQAVDLLLRISALFIVMATMMIALNVTDPDSAEEMTITQSQEQKTLPDIIPEIDARANKPETYSAEFEEELEMSALFYATEPLGRYYITAYSHIETGSKITASGRTVHQGNITSAAADVPKYFRFGDYIEVNGRIYRIEDTGTAVKRRHLDLYEPDMKKLDGYTGYRQVYRVTFPFGKPED